MTQVEGSPANLGEHAERMDQMYRYQRHIYDLTRKYYLLGRDRTIEALQIPQHGSLLEVGCGTGPQSASGASPFPHSTSLWP